MDTTVKSLSLFGLIWNDKSLFENSTTDLDIVGSFLKVENECESRIFGFRDEL